MKTGVVFETNFNFQIEEWGPNERYRTVLAAADHAIIAHAGFAAAVLERPGSRILMRQGMRLVHDSHQGRSKAGLKSGK